MSGSKIFGLHAVNSAITHSSTKITQAWVDKNRQDKRLKHIYTELTDLKIPLSIVDRRELDKIAASQNHQGVVIEVDLPGLRSEHQLREDLQTISATPFLLVLDQVQDPHNFGACLRTADAAGVNGVIITKDKSVGITPTVCKVACGAAETVPVYQVTNLARSLRMLQENGLWIVGSSDRAEQSLYTTDLTMPLALVMGTEESGMRQLTTKHCDYLVKIPMQGQVESLNVSVAAGIMMFEVLRQRQ